MSSLSLPVLTVRRHDRTLVVPEKPTPKELIQVSDIDQHPGLRIHVPILLFYKNNPSMERKDPRKVIRKALAQALSSYYPSAGRLTEGPCKKLFVDCTSEGIPFIEAEADAPLIQVTNAIESGAVPLFEDLLRDDVPGSSGILGCPLWLFQVTRFKCGGFTVALRFNHIITDGSGVAQFMNAVAEYARGEKTLSLSPVWKREYFLAREPPHVTCQHLEWEVFKNISPEATSELENNSMIHKSFYFGSKEIRALKTHLQNQNGKKYTTFEVITACVWRCRTRALKLNPDQIVQLPCIANGRYEKELQVPPGYYGNVVAGPSIIVKFATLCNNSLEYAADLVKKAKSKMSGEYLRSAIDYTVSKRQLKVSPWMFTVSDTRGIGIDEIDFGWGKPLLGGPARSIFSISFYSRFKDGVLVPVCLPQKMMDRFELELKELLESVTEST